MANKSRQPILFRTKFVIANPTLSPVKIFLLEDIEELRQSSEEIQDVIGNEADGVVWLDAINRSIGVASRTFTLDWLCYVSIRRDHPWFLKMNELIGNTDLDKDPLHFLMENLGENAAELCSKYREFIEGLVPREAMLGKCVSYMGPTLPGSIVKEAVFGGAMIEAAGIPAYDLIKENSGLDCASLAWAGFSSVETFGHGESFVDGVLRQRPMSLIDAVRASFAVSCYATKAYEKPMEPFPLIYKTQQILSDFGAILSSDS